MMEMVKSLLEENGYPTEGLTEETSFESLVWIPGFGGSNPFFGTEGLYNSRRKLSEIKTVGDLLRVLGGNA